MQRRQANASLDKIIHIALINTVRNQREKAQIAKRAEDQKRDRVQLGIEEHINRRSIMEQATNGAEELHQTYKTIALTLIAIEVKTTPTKNERNRTVLQQEQAATHETITAPILEESAAAIEEQSHRPHARQLTGKFFSQQQEYRNLENDGWVIPEATTTDPLDDYDSCSVPTF